MRVFKRDGSQYYWYEFQCNGQRYQDSTKRTNKADAMTVAAEVRKSVIEGKPIIKSSKTLFKDVAHEYLVWFEKKWSANHLKNARGMFNTWFIPCWGNKPITKITFSDVEKFLFWRETQPCYHGRPPSKHELKSELRYLTTFFNRCMDGTLNNKRYITRNPCLDDKSKPIKVKVPEKGASRCLDGEELGMMLKYNGWLHDILVFIKDTGVRLDECLSLSWPQVNMKERSVLVYASKTENERNIPMSTAIYEMFKNRVRSLKTDFVFYRFTDLTNPIHPNHARYELKRRVIPETGARFRFLDLRHTFITRMLCEFGIDLKTVQYLAGHKNIKTTEGYLHTKYKYAVNAIQQMEAIENQRCGINPLH